jgi:hypothetical protein
MSQVTIYLDPPALEAAKLAAWAEIDRLRTNVADDGWDFLLDPKTRHSGMGEDLQRESLD